MHRPSFSLGGQNADQVAEICRRLDGIPLAIELAAARVRSMEVDEILGRLQNRLRLLATGSRLAPPRQQTLRASIDWSYNLLSPSECLLLGRLAVFVGGWTLAAAEAVCAGGELTEVDVLDLLGQLVDRSLVVAEAGRYHLLETIREYALERLVDGGEAAALRERHAAYFAAYLGERYDAILSSQQRRVKAEINVEIGNIRAAWDWAVAARRAGLLRSSERVLVWYCELYGRFYEGEALFARAVQQLATDQAADPGLLALLRAEYGYSLARLGRLAAARDELEQGCAQLRSVGSPADLATGLTLLGMVVWQEGDYPRAQALLEESLGLHRRVEDRGMIGLCLFFLALVEQTIGNAAQAEGYFGEALALGRSSDHPRLIAMTSVHSVPSLLALGQPAQARERLQEGLALAHATQDRWLEFAALGYLGRVLGSQGDYAGARTALQETLALAHETGNLQDQAWAEVGLGDVTLAAGEAALAEAHYRSGLQLAMQAAALPKALDAVAGLAVLRARAGDPEGALELAAQVAHHPASSGAGRARAAQVLRMLVPDSASLTAALGAPTFEEIVRGILYGS
jgi:predicted ATPase